MATVTGLTADRMLAIEAASVVDGDIVGDNLILTQHGGTQINAGNVRGPKGDAGPVGQDLVVVSAAPVLEVGLAGQIRAGRQFTAADFTNMGLSTPSGVWNLSDLTDVSGNGRNLLNKGAVTTTVGINGLANTAAKFVGNAAQGLYIPDSGANDPFRLKVGSYGCWFKSSKRGVEGVLMSRNYNATNHRSWYLETFSNPNALVAGLSTDGAAIQVTVATYSDVCDDQWHFAVVTYDGTRLCLYLDATLESVARIQGIYFQATAPLNIGNVNADAATVGNAPFTGLVDEAFVTNDILTEDQIAVLYCAKLTHTLAAIPSRVSINVQRRRAGAALTVADFPIQPVRLHNFSGGSVGDEGSNGVALSNATGCLPTAAVDGTPNNAYNFNLACYLESTDAGMPQLATPRSYGCWFKTMHSGVYQTVMGYGVGLFRVSPTGFSESWSGAGGITSGKNLNDGKWHHVVVVHDPGSLEGSTHRVYLDGRLVGSDSALAATSALAGKFYIGCDGSNGLRFMGQIDSAFVVAAALKADEITKIYSKSTQILGISPKNAGDHIEIMNATDLLVNFDSLPMQSRVDVRVSA